MRHLSRIKKKRSNLSTHCVSVEVVPTKRQNIDMSLTLLSSDRDNLVLFKMFTRPFDPAADRSALYSVG